VTPRPEVTRLVVNQSSRGGVAPRVIVLHTTEGHDRPGVEDLRGLGAFFNQPAAQASSHVANDQEGNDARFVPDSRKAWTQAAANPYCLSIEQVGFAAFGRKEWVTHRMPQLKNTAEWIAYWSKLHGIPIEHSPSRGVCEHRDLGPMGGGHHDCGDGYPLDVVLKLAEDANPAVRKLAKWRAELDKRRAQLQTAQGSTRRFLIRRIGELKRAIGRTR
jgi:hypothetical protein